MLYPKPNNGNKPLRIVQGAGYHYLPGALQREKELAMDALLDDTVKRGYGGVVANVAEFDDYLNNESDWQAFIYFAESCRRRGLRLWIYDEKGYPSGSAGGNTLKENPDFESKALAAVFKKVSQGDNIEIPLPKGHLFAIYAAAYDGSSIDEINLSSAIDLTANISDKGELKWTADRACFVAYFAVKPFYERTHAMFNCYAARRTVDLSDENAVKAFIGNTYEQYIRRLKPFLGNTVEAFFTDEPSYMGFYMADADAAVTALHHIDDYDRTMPFYPCVNWGNDFCDKFKALKGYDIRPYLPYLFGGMQRDAVKVRADYYEALSEFLEHSYFGQIGDFCHSAGVKFSGHVLAEDNIVKHLYFEGDLFRLMKHMGIPGIDMLTAQPEKFMNWPDSDFFRCDEGEIINWATGPKLVSSIAGLYGKRRVMSEVSGHMEGAKCSFEKSLCTAFLQYAAGVNVFTSYFSFSESEGNRFCNAVARADAILSEGTYSASVALYYPIRQMRGYALPGECGASSAKETCDKIMNAAAYTFAFANRVLLTSQTGYDMIGFDELSASKTENETFSFRERKYKLLIVPACPIDEVLKSELKRFSENGIKIVVLTHKETAAFADLTDILARKISPVAEDLLAAVKEEVPPDIECSDKELVVSAYKTEKYTFYLAVNYRNETIKERIAIPGGKTMAVYRPDTDTFQNFNGCVEFSAYEAVVILPEE